MLLEGGAREERWRFKAALPALRPRLRCGTVLCATSNIDESSLPRPPHRPRGRACVAHLRAAELALCTSRQQWGAVGGRGGGGKAARAASACQIGTNVLVAALVEPPRGVAANLGGRPADRVL